jgi:hypothetical protein
MVSVDDIGDPEVTVTGLGRHFAELFDGVPDTLRVTFPVNPPLGVMVIVYDAFTFLVAVDVSGEADSDIPAGAFTTCVTTVDVLASNFASPL